LNRRDHSLALVLRGGGTITATSIRRTTARLASNAGGINGTELTFGRQLVALAEKSEGNAELG